MKLSELLTNVRSALGDTVEDYLWSGTELTGFANDAINEMCEKCHILEDATTSITKTGSSNITFTTTTNRISGTGFHTAGFPAVSTFTVTGTSNNNGTFTVKDYDELGTWIDVNESLTTESNTSAVMTATVAITFLPTVESTDIYSIDSRIIRITRAKLSTATTKLSILGDDSTDYLDAKYGDWENADDSTPTLLCTNGFGTNKIKLYQPPDSNSVGILRFRVLRRPLIPLNFNTPSMSIEIAEQYQRLLLNGILYRAYLKYDSETYDKNRAADLIDKWLGKDLSEVHMLKRFQQRRNTVTSPPMGTIG